MLVRYSLISFLFLKYLFFSYLILKNYSLLFTHKDKLKLPMDLKFIEECIFFDKFFVFDSLELEIDPSRFFWILKFL